MKDSNLAAVSRAARYEFRMQIRRKAVWITFALFFSLLAFTGMSNPWDFPPAAPLVEVVANWSVDMQTLMPIAFGVLLADRLPRDRRTGVGEMLDTLPAASGGRLAGKYLGSVAATLIPLFLVYAVGIAYVVAERGEPRAILMALATFSAINLPGLLFVGAFSVSVPAVMWVPLYQFLFIGYWFWGNLLSPDFGIPTLSNTWLTPVGDYMASGFFGVTGLWTRDVAAWEGTVSIGLLLALGALALYIAHRCLL